MNNAQQGPAPQRWEADGRATGLFKWGKAGTGSHQLALQFEIVTPGDRCGQKWPWYGTVETPDAIEYVAGVLRACGWAGDWADFSSITRNMVRLTFEQDPESGRWSLVFVNAPGIPMKDELSDAERGALVTRLNRIGAGQKGNKR